MNMEKFRKNPRLNLETNLDVEVPREIADKITELEVSEEKEDVAASEVQREASYLVDKLERAGLESSYSPSQQVGILTRLGASRVTNKLRALILGLTLAGSAEALADKPHKIPASEKSDLKEEDQDVPHIQYEFGPYYYTGDMEVRKLNREGITKRLSNDLFSINYQQKLLDQYRIKYGNHPNFGKFESQVNKILEKRRKEYEEMVKAVKEARTSKASIKTKGGGTSSVAGDLEYRKKGDFNVAVQATMVAMLKDAGIEK